MRVGEQTGIPESDSQVSRVYRFLLIGFFKILLLKGGWALNPSKSFGYKCYPLYFFLRVRLESVHSFPLVDSLDCHLVVCFYTVGVGGFPWGLPPCITRAQCYEMWSPAE